MKVDMPVGIKNKFTFRVDDIVTGEHREYEAYNIVLNAMWSRLVNFQPFFVNIHFGTGTGTFDDPTRTSLYTHLGTKTATTEFEVRDLPTSQRRRKIVLNPEEYVGATITEIGVAYGSTASNLVTHAAPKDAEGNPIAIGPKTDTQIITIYADMYFVLQESMYGGKIKWVTPLENNELLSYLMGGSYPAVRFRVSRVPSFDKVFWSGGQSGSVNPSGWIKNAADKLVTMPVQRLGTSIGNGELRGFQLGSSDALGTFRAHLPIVDVLTSIQITETVGAGDDTKLSFNPTWSNAVITAVKIDSNTVNSGDYQLAITRKGTNVFKFMNVQLLSGPSPSNPLDNLTDNNETVGTGASIGAVTLGIDIGSTYGAMSVNVFRVLAGSNSASRNLQLYGSNNSDYSSSVLLAEVEAKAGVSWDEVEFTPVSYRYFRVVKTASLSHDITQIELLTASDQITFTTPPPAGAVITADYSLDYIPKDEFHVLDLQAAIQYGEVI